MQRTFELSTHMKALSRFGEKARELDDGTTGPAHAKKLREFIAQRGSSSVRPE